jgi:hypothetical protein
MLTVVPPDAALLARIEELLEARWMPGDWFKMTPEVVRHYAWKASICRQALLSLWITDFCPIIEIGTRCGYSLAAFLAASREVCDVRALCFDAGIDEDSEACLRHFSEWVQFNRIPAQLVRVNTQSVSGLPWVGFAHVDGSHTYEGALHDLELVAASRTILADDCDNGAVLEAVREFARRHPGRSTQFVNDGLRTLGVISWDGPTGAQG